MEAVYVVAAGAAAVASSRGVLPHELDYAADLAPHLHAVDEPVVTDERWLILFV